MSDAGIFYFRRFCSNEDPSVALHQNDDEELSDDGDGNTEVSGRAETEEKSNQVDGRHRNTILEPEQNEKKVNFRHGERECSKSIEELRKGKSSAGTDHDVLRSTEGEREDLVCATDCRRNATDHRRRQGPSRNNASVQDGKPLYRPVVDEGEDNVVAREHTEALGEGGSRITTRWSDPDNSGDDERRGDEEKFG